MADPAQTPGGLPFPTDPQEFDSDERISFSRLDNKFLAVNDDGTEYEFDNQLKRWIPQVDEELVRQQQQAYGVGGDDDDGADSQHNNKKRKTANGSDRPNKKHKQPPAPRQNTAIYVTGLPADATVEEVHDVFSRKCGVIAEEIDSGNPRIKLYTDADGKFKGDALIVFFKPQSVDMAIMLLDDTPFRFSASDPNMRVQAADSSYKKTTYDKDAAGGAGVIKRTQKLDAKLADWDDDDPYGGQLETNARKDRVVILRHMFTLQELEEDPAALLDIKEDIRDECSKLGAVTNVVLYDLEVDGVASVKFKDPSAAEACVNLMDGRAFDGRTVRASIATGKEKLRQSGKDKGDVEDDEH
ncbi:putative nuclear mRNA splicing factor-associated protein [Microdochium trichocladiopsis]|uniref:Nuclear mRNA splicing factor-associated protein n=1 Tax=Microdochium trichocladiopsis TaxID=1682393 RepID=A0A9P8Y975_9PEZI|nr:putative nuclear mRNA splicing factor-associated protein [Microdochium trichocladiopsis]KAH7035329.1 putative nuclear mRNA splicing factor-associated protein [Microdochium trichocladiopsis]